MSLNSKYSPAEVEEKWYDFWEKHGFFHSEPNPDKEPYTIVIPPPNVTGVLHMGHMLNNTIQDILVRKARMEGKEAVWVPGTDHASIATEAKVVNMLAERGINKQDLTREEFLKHAWEWKEKYGGIILQQLRKLGASCDWERTRFTMEEEMSEAVVKVFVDLYNKGHIYRGKRMVNWDPQGLTALADDEVIYREVDSRLYYINYPVAGSHTDSVTIATTRPETILGDSAVCVNPNDERYQHLKGKKVRVPLIDREIPVIEDEYVTMEFGTGCLKVTPSHDENDYDLGVKHNLAFIDILNDNGTLNENAQLYVGQDRFEVRKQIAKDLQEKGFLQKEEEYKNNVGFSERTDAVIEPRISMQWFVSMKNITKPALENVMNDTVQLHPPKFKNMYRSWMENVRDWCISRQLWWGHRIPAWYLPNGEIVVAENEDAALAKAREQMPEISAQDLRQDEDVLDTWFSSGLWPMSVFNGINEPDNEEINYYYPTNDLVTAPEILFFWVARMIIFGYEYRNEAPFKNVYLTGIVRDSQRRKMSKQLGNSPDPIALINTFGADGIRAGMLFSSPAGNDLLFDEKLCEQGRNFANKIWNAFRLVEGWEVNDALPADTNAQSVKWFEACYHAALAALEKYFTQFRISDALKTVYQLIWQDFCSSYLEMVKPAYQQAIDRATYEATIQYFENLMKVLHPFMPFISEEIWHQISERDTNDCLIVAAWPRARTYDEKLIRSGEAVLEAVSQVRNTRNSRQIADKQALSLFIKSDTPELYQNFEGVICKLANIEKLDYTEDKIDGAASFIVNSVSGEPDEFFIPLEGAIDVEAELARLNKELEYNKGFLNTCNKKLGNQKFVDNAPKQVVEMEYKKKADAEAKIKSIEESIQRLS